MKQALSTIYPNGQQRPYFRAGQQLTPERLNRIQQYMLQRSREVLAGVMGSGVVHGFNVFCQGGKVRVMPGLALDSAGRVTELEQPQDISLTALIGEASLSRSDFKSGWYSLKVHYAERTLSNKAGCGCPAVEADYVQEGVMFTLEWWQEGDCSEQLPNAEKEEERLSCLSAQHFACEKSQASCVDSSAGDLCHVAEDGSLYDRGAGVVIAALCLSWQEDDCGGRPCCQRVEVCHENSGRQLIYPNALLFGLASGAYAQPTRISSVKIGDYRLPLQEAFPTDLAGILKKEGITLEFSRAIDVAALQPGWIYINVLSPIQAGHDVQRFDPGEPVFSSDNHKVTVKLAPECSMKGVILELVVRTAWVCDAEGCMLDGSPLGAHCRTGSGVNRVGGDFVITIDFQRAVDCMPDEQAEGE